MGIFNNDNELRDQYGNLPDTQERRAWGAGVFAFWLFCAALGIGLVVYLFTGGNF